MSDGHGSRQRTRTKVCSNAVDPPSDDADRVPLARPVLYTEPLAPNTNTAVFYYVFGATCQPDFFGSRTVESQTILKTLACGGTWNEARFLLEKKHGLFDVKQQKANLVGSYFQGLFWKDGLTNWRTEAQPVPRDHIMHHHDRIIVLRKPLLRGMLPYVPDRFKPEMETLERSLVDPREREREERVGRFLDQLNSKLDVRQDLTEEEKIERIMEKMEDRNSVETLKDRLLHKFKRSRYGAFHPSDIELDPSIVNPPPAHYMCHRCLRRGHWKNMCPTLNDLSFVQRATPKLPSGIPKSMLREAQTDEERRGAMLADDGRLVVMKTYASLV